MMLGCSSLADVRASRWNRSTNSLSNARENGRTLIATSRSSCFSRALKTMAIPPRPSSSMISYSSFSCSRTRSCSVASTGWSRTAATGVVCDRSSPQDRQNLLASSFWVPQREQYINSPMSRGNLGIYRTTCQLVPFQLSCFERSGRRSAPHTALVGMRDRHQWERHSRQCPACSKVRSECRVPLRPPRAAGRRSGERLRNAESHRERKVVAHRHPARELDSGGAKSGEARGCAGRPGVTGVGKQVEPDPVNAHGKVTEGATHQRERHPILDAARGRARAAQLAGRVPAERKRARRAQRRREEDIHALGRHAPHAEQRAERTVGGTGEEPQRQHVVSEGTRTGYPCIQGQPGAQLIRPAGAALLFPPAVGRGPRDPVLR